MSAREILQQKLVSLLEEEMAETFAPPRTTRTFVKHSVSTPLTWSGW